MAEAAAGIVVAEPEVPLEQRLVYGSREHDSLLTRLVARVDLAERHISSRYDDWDRVDEHCRLYVDLSRQARKGDKTTDPNLKEMPFQRAIVVPLSLSVLQVRMTQLLAIFGSRQPMIQFEGRGAEDVKAAKLMETVVDYDLQQMPALPVFHALLQDAEKYGLGVTYDYWNAEYGWKPRRRLPPLIEGFLSWAGISLPEREWAMTREGNVWEPVDPFNFWPDPRVPISQLQQGEFVGHRSYRGSLHIKERAVANGGPYFNTEKLKEVAAAMSQRQRGASSRNRVAKDQFSLRSGESVDDESGFHALDHLQVKLIPRDWKLGPGERPEIWWFTVADEGLICRAHPSRYDHGRFTYSAAESIPDYHAQLNQGMVENLDGLQRFMNWLLNSHVENARKHLNDAMIYAPGLIEEADLLNPGPTRHIRLSKKGEELVLQGRLTLAQVVQQITLVDVTSPHLRTLQVFMDMAQRMSGISDPQMSQTTDDKRTLGEVQQIIASSSQRLAMVARMIDAQAIHPLAKRAVANRQQFTELEQWFRISGDMAKEFDGAKQLQIRPPDLAGDFDYIPHSGIIPPDPERYAQVWIRLLEGAAKLPQVIQPGPDGKVLDLREIFNEAARAAGVKDIEHFYVSVVSDEAVADGVVAGNLIPAGAVPPGGGPIPGAGIQTPIVPAGVNLRG